MSIEIRFQHVVMYETDDKEEALRWAEKDLKEGNIRADDLEIIGSTVY